MNEGLASLALILLGVLYLWYVFSLARRQEKAWEIMQQALLSQNRCAPPPDMEVPPGVLRPDAHHVPPARGIQ